MPTGPQEVGSVGVEDVLAEDRGVGLVPALEPADDVAARPARRQVAVLAALPQFARVTHSTPEASVARALVRRRARAVNARWVADWLATLSTFPVLVTGALLRSGTLAVQAAFRADGFVTQGTTPPGLASALVWRHASSVLALRVANWLATRLAFPAFLTRTFVRNSACTVHTL